MGQRARRIAFVMGMTILGGCSSTPKPAQEPPAPSASTAGTGGEVSPGSEGASAPGFGGRLFDHWAKELKLEFTPDRPDTAELDGSGGPFGNGTLPDQQGNPMPNTGHDYRLKNLFGWDLRGGDGIYGARYKNKTHVLLPDLLKNTESREDWVERLTRGEDAIPAYGSVLTPEQIEALADFLIGVRDGRLPQPDHIFALSEGTPGNYVLNTGADPEHGHTYFAGTCASCHGADGAAFPLDGGAHTLGSLMRVEAYETWLKVLNGQPGSSMHAQVPLDAPEAELAAIVRDLHAAVCDRTRYPKTAAGEDVADGDPRCGAYLK